MEIVEMNRNCPPLPAREPRHVRGRKARAPRLQQAAHDAIEVLAQQLPLLFLRAPKPGPRPRLEEHFIARRDANGSDKAGIPFDPNRGRKQ